MKVFLSGNLCEGCLCGYQSDDGIFFRAQVLKFSQPLGFYFPHKEQARVLNTISFILLLF